MRALADRLGKRGPEGDVGPGMLYATGLVAGGSLAGIAIALLTGFGGKLADALNIGGGYFEKMGSGGDVISFVMFAGFAGLLLRQALAKTA